MTHIRLADAKFCPQCLSIFTNKDSGIPLTDCPCCTNRMTIPLQVSFEKERRKAHVIGNQTV